MILSKYYIFYKFHYNPFSSKVLFNVFQVFLEGMGFVLSLIGRLGEWYPVKGTDLSISDCNHDKLSTTAQNLIISNFARGMKKLQIRKVFLAFILLTSSYCSRDPTFVLFSIIGHFVFQIANVLNKFLKIKVHQKEFYSEIPLKIVLGKRIILCEQQLFCVNSVILQN